jgi:hypothetical protein
LVAASDLKSGSLIRVWVQIPPRPLFEKKNMKLIFRNRTDLTGDYFSLEILNSKLKYKSYDFFYGRWKSKDGMYTLFMVGMCNYVEEKNVSFFWWDLA